MTTPIIIDTDPGIDDIIAISAALNSPELDVRLITSIGGNVGIEHTTRNAIDIVDYFKKEVPVAKGVNKPLLNALSTAEYVHGHNGIGNYEFNTSQRSNILEDNAVIAMRNVIMQSDEPITLVPIGPLTNISLLFSLFPETIENVEKIVLMGGATVGGNATPVAEFNIFADPHAAHIVFNQDLPIVMCGLDVTRETMINQDDVERLAQLGDFGKMITTMLDVYNDSNSGGPNQHIIHDLSTIFYLLYPEIYETKKANISVITEGQAEGCTYTEFNEDGLVDVCIHADNEKFRSYFVDFVEDIYKEFG